MTIKYLYSKFFKKIIRGKSILNSKINSTAKIYSGTSFYNSNIGRYSYVDMIVRFTIVILVRFVVLQMVLLQVVPNILLIGFLLLLFFIMLMGGPVII